MKTTTLRALLPAALLALLPPAVAAAEEAVDPAADPHAADPGEIAADGPAAKARPEPEPVRSSLPRGLRIAAVPGLDGSGAAVVDEGDEPEIEQEIEAQSAEMEQLREAEESAPLAEPSRGEDSAARGAARLGLESPLRQRLGDALGREMAAPPEEQGRIALLPELDHDLKRLQAEYDIPLEVNESVVAYIRFFQSEPARKHFVRWLARSHRYLDRFRAILKEHGLPQDTVFLAMIESGFANLAYSRARASGPWQFIAATGRRMGLKQDFWVDERRDPEKAAHAAARYLAELHEQTGDWRLAWASYNAGPGKIMRALSRGQGDFWSMARGRVIRRETKGYVPKLMAAAIIAKHPEAFGFEPDEIEPEHWVAYDEVAVPEAVPLAAVAQAAGVSEKDLLDLNPELRRSCTPPRKYALKVPKGHAHQLEDAWPSLSQSSRLIFVHHRVHRGESLVAIAAGYGVSPSAVVRMNGLRPGRRLRSGTELVIALSAQARRNGRVPGSETAARARIQDYQRQNPSSVEPDPAPKPLAMRTEEVAGRLRTTVLVQAGDTLWAIAQKFGVGLDELCRWNGIRNPRRLKLQVGREIVVYPRSTGAAPLPTAASLGGPG